MDESIESADNTLGVLPFLDEISAAICMAHFKTGIVVYASARVVSELMAMSEAGRRTTEARLDLLQLDGLTNLWAGLQKGIELLGAATEPGRLQHIMLLTDGIPNQNPPRGIIPMLKRLKEKAGGVLPCTINTFGFGYELDSTLLSEIATIGSGTYAFIPDAGFVGTVFVNAMANLLVTMATNAKLTIEPMNGAAFAVVEGSMAPGGHPCRKVGNALQMDLCTLQFGQCKEAIVHLTLPAAASRSEWLRVTLRYDTRSRSDAEERSCIAKGPPDGCGREEEIQITRIRSAFVDTVTRAMASLKLNKLEAVQGKAMPMPAAQAMIQTMDDAISGTTVARVQAVQAMQEDLHGQVAEAVSRQDWYTKWGVHFLPSLIGAHLYQQCNNFKDPGVQNYGGELFTDLRDKADDVFLALPAPTPAVKPVVAAAPVPAVRAAVANFVPVTMAAYHDRHAG